MTARGTDSSEEMHVLFMNLWKKNKNEEGSVEVHNTEVLSSMTNSILKGNIFFLVSIMWKVFSINRKY